MPSTPHRVVVGLNPRPLDPTLILYAADLSQSQRWFPLPPSQTLCTPAFLVAMSGSRISFPRLAAVQQNPATMPFYAIARGHRPGVYSSWDEAKKQVERFPDARHKKFKSESEALAFIAENCGTGGSTQSGAARSPPQQRTRGAAKVKEGSNGGEEKFLEDYERLMEGDSSDPHPMDPSTLVAFTDGSALSNGTPRSRAGWACVFPHTPAWSRAAPLAGEHQTNNRAEYRAAIEAILRANAEDPGQVKPLYIYSDSMLLIRSMTEWIPGWIARGWKKADKAPVLNADLLKTLLSEQGNRRIIWRHVPAHTNGSDWKSKWNDLADQMAKEQASK